MSDGNETDRRQRSNEISKPVHRELAALPEKIRDQFLVALENISWGLDPGLKVAHLSTAESGVLELKINGSPAYRLVYTLKFAGKVVVLAARPKTCNGTDRQLMAVVASRLKDYS